MTKNTNKQLNNVCAFYKDIICAHYPKNDAISGLILQIYKLYVKSAKIEEIEELKNFDESVYIYFYDSNFNKKLTDEFYDKYNPNILSEMIKKNGIKSIIKIINEFYLKYKTTSKDKLSTTRWI